MIRNISQFLLWLVLWPSLSSFTQASLVIYPVHSATVLALASSCQRYAKQANESVFQTEAAVAGSKVQLHEAETKAASYRELAKEGAISQTQLDKAVNQVQTAKKNLDQAIAKQRQAKQQLATLQKMTSCAAP